MMKYNMLTAESLRKQIKNNSGCSKILYKDKIVNINDMTRKELSDVIEGGYTIAGNVAVPKANVAKSYSIKYRAWDSVLIPHDGGCTKTLRLKEFQLEAIGWPMNNNRFLDVDGEVYIDLDSVVEVM